MAVQKKDPTGTPSDGVRYALISILIVAAFFGAYRFAAARSAQAQGADAQASAALASTSGAGAAVIAGDGGLAAGGATDGSAAGGSCCGGGTAVGGSASGGSTAGGCCGGTGGSQKQVIGTATVSGGVQKISVSVTTAYNPNVLKLKTGVPAEITFSAAQGCTGVVQSRALGFAEDLTTGPKTVQVKGLQPGTYDFECGMNMVQGQIVVQ